MSAPLSAQTTGTMPGALGGSIVLNGEWLQANALPLDREALHSVSLGASYRRDRWAVDGGWLRIARSLSTIQGAYLSAGPLLRYSRFTIIPQVSALVGQAQASVDSTGYDFISSTGVPGHVPRYSYSSATSIGAGVGLTVETPIYGPLNARAGVSQWYFGGTPLEGDRNRTLVGLGLSLKVWQ